MRLRVKSPAQSRRRSATGRHDDAPDEAPARDPGSPSSPSGRRRRRAADTAAREAERDDDGGMTLSTIVTIPLWRSISYPVMFGLGVAFSLAFGWFQPHHVPEPVKEQARAASASISKAFDEVLSAESLQSLANTTAKLREVLDFQAGMIANATSGFRLPNTGIRDLLNVWQVPSIDQVLGKTERVGVRMAKRGVTIRNPVVMIPGIITTALEVWDGEPCMNTYFRQRIWGTATMFQSLMRDPDCWVRHLALNATTGLDPLQRPGYNRSIRVRPAQGFESADFFLGGYWLWGLMIEALADIGYDGNSMAMASYDWRLNFPDLEKRDHYFTRLRQQIELFVSTSGRKVVIIAHSMGGNVWHYFMQWVTHRVHKNWINDHISSEVMISAPVLGLPKAYFSLLTGDNRDFASMGTFSAVVNHFFAQPVRRWLWRSCSSLALILPLGGDSIWGEDVTGRPMVQLQGRNLTVSEAYDLLATGQFVPEDLRRITPWLLDGVRRSRPPEADPAAAAHAPPEHVWANPLASPLPFAPRLRKYAFYGTGVQTEIAGALEEASPAGPGQEALYAINTTDDPWHFADGDYSCPVMTLGAMCYKGWKDEARNPGRTPCTVREYADKPAPSSFLSAKAIQEGVVETFRGGAASGDHIDILGNEELLTDVLTIVSGGDVEPRVTSDLPTLTERWSDK